MHPSLDKLRKFFRLEHENGYNNTAIIGGLARMLDYWEGEARVDGLTEEVIQAVVQRLRSYDGLKPESRADSLKGLWKRVGEQYPDAVHKSEQKPSSSAKPSGSGDVQSLPPRRGEPEGGRGSGSRPPGRSETAPGAKTSATPAALNAALTVLQGVGPKHAETLSKLGMHTLGDMLYYFPRRYEDYSQLKPIKSLWYGEHVTVIGSIQSVQARPIRGGKAQMVDVVLTDGTGGLRLSWFNQPWMANRLKEGEQVSVSGRVEQYLGRLVMNNPDWESVEVENLHTNRIVPIYSLTEKITQKWLRNLMNQVITYWAPAVPDALPESVRSSAKVMPLGQALLQVHFPDSQEKLKAARERLAFDEIFYLQMGVLRQKKDWQSVEANVFEAADDWLNARIAALPFALTNAQQRVLGEMRADLKSGKPMNRLLQGDVGSGKTVVAALAAGIIANAGAQAAIMAPTSILAEQHYRSFTSLLAGENGILQEGQIRLLIGDTPESEKEALRAGLADGSVKIVIGTHALLEEPVGFHDLQFAVIDEQHRFGVDQRAALRAKGGAPHLLVMTATPIPRSLQLTIFGDLDVSVLDEMPVGRKPVTTHLLTPQERERAYSLIRSQVQSGNQAFIVYPLVEVSEEAKDQRAAVDDSKILSSEIFADLKLGLLHGRMTPGEKDRIMTEFRDKKYDILVATIVIEVGIDIPNATVILIEGADRFGLAQLHQLRGRVGRGTEDSMCLLIPTEASDSENERLQAMVRINDGFELADLDLKLRGMGEIFGVRQSGKMVMIRLANLTDIAFVQKVQKHAMDLLAMDPDLTRPEHTLTAEALGKFWS